MAAPLSDRQARFVEEYLVDLNASAAYQRAGYKARGNAAEVNASRLLRNAKVAAAIAAGQAARSKVTGIKADRVLAELAKIAFSDLGEVLDFSGQEVKLRPASTIPEAARQAVASLKVKRSMEGRGDDAYEVEVTEFKLWDKGKALEQLARHLGLFNDKLTVATRPTNLEDLTNDELLRIAGLARNPPESGTGA